MSAVDLGFWYTCCQPGEKRLLSPNGNTGDLGSLKVFSGITAGLLESAQFVAA